MFDDFSMENRDFTIAFNEISLQRLNELEIIFLNIFQFNMNISIEEYFENEKEFLLQINHQEYLIDNKIENNKDQKNINSIISITIEEEKQQQEEEKEFIVIELDNELRSISDSPQTVTSPRNSPIISNVSSYDEDCNKSFPLISYNSILYNQLSSFIQPLYQTEFSSLSFQTFKNSNYNNINSLFLSCFLDNSNNEDQNKNELKLLSK